MNFITFYLCPVSRTEVAEIVKKPLGGKAPGLDQIKFLKALDVVGQSSLISIVFI